MCFESSVIDVSESVLSIVIQFIFILLLLYKVVSYFLRIYHEDFWLIKGRLFSKLNAGADINFS